MIYKYKYSTRQHNLPEINKNLLKGENAKSETGAAWQPANVCTTDSKCTSTN
jgi:hypothetical protein